MGDLKSTNRESHLGALWWVLDPLLYLLVFYFVFGVFLNRGGEGFVAYLLIGLVFWRWFESSLHQTSSIIFTYKTILDQVYIPKLYLPYIPVISNFVKSSMIIAMLLAYLFVFEGAVLSEIIWFPVLMVTQLMLILAVGSFLAAILPFYPDGKNLIGYGINLMFFMSAIFYRIDDMPEDIRYIFLLNPLAYLIDAYRGVLMEGQAPAMGNLVMIILASVFVYGVSLFMLNKYDKHYPKILN